MPVGIRSTGMLLVEESLKEGCCFSELLYARCGTKDKTANRNK
ncbi:hypothetical protein BD94_0700 [Elizabethkingia anophelis NUHP1]|uniref:Uncharacterized protein n=1 Tax=Elizabethkingia anophelis NUHP1 TaxID=1338011 RepID=A0A077EG19_9FLAO|nr:hypothetical protein BD94_0700 [Elizabethkingia anophelis NUHP1]